jgi:hypothetical protein
MNKLNYLVSTFFFFGFKLLNVSGRKEEKEKKKIE